MEWVPPIKMKVIYQPQGTGIAGHNQPAIHLHWAPGFTIPHRYFRPTGASPGDIVRMDMPAAAKDLGLFYQGESREWMMLEFWTDREDKVRKDVLEPLLKIFEPHMDGPVIEQSSRRERIH